MTHTAGRAARKHAWKLIGVGLLIFGILIAVPIGMRDPNGPLGWFLTIGILAGAAGVFIIAAYIDRAIRRHRRRFFEGT